MRLAERRGLLKGPSLSRVQEWGLEILCFLDGVQRARDRQDMVLASAVSSGVISAVQAWPEYFGEDAPGGGDEVSAFRLEAATPESFAADMQALIQASQRVTLREPPVPRSRQNGALPDAIWP